MNWYLDGAQYVVIKTGMPEQAVQIGIGDNPDEAIENLEETGIQSCGHDSGLSAALSWSNNAGWISHPRKLQAISAPTDGVLKTNACTDHEDVEGWYESLGWHRQWDSDDSSGQLVHPVCSVDDLRTKTDSEILAEKCPEGAGEEERGAYESAIEYAREGLQAAEVVVSALEAAVEAYEARETDACITAIKEAMHLESDYGDDPAAQHLADALLFGGYQGMR